MLGLISGSWSWGMGGRLAPQLVCVEPQCSSVSPGFGWPSAGPGTFKKGAVGRTVLGEGLRVIVPSHPGRLGALGLLEPAQRLFVCLVCRALRTGLCGPGSGVWMVALPPPGLGDSPRHLLSQPHSSTHRPGWSGGDFVPKSAIFGDTLAVRTGRQGVGRWGMVSGEYQPGCC